MKKGYFIISLFLFVLLGLNACGFKPIYYMSEQNWNPADYALEIKNVSNASREIKDEINRVFQSNSNMKQNYIVEVDIIENLDPLITNTDGTISKYRIEILLNFKVKDKNKNEYIMNDMVRGFAQYAVETSEIESDDKKKIMVRTATSSAMQMMVSKIQSSISISNDN